MGDYPTHAEAAAKIAAGGGGGGGATSLWLHSKEMYGVYGNPGIANGDGFGTLRNSNTLPHGSNGSWLLAKQLPPGWATFAIDLWWWVATTGGNVRWRVDTGQDVNGSAMADFTAVAGGATYTVAAAPAVNTMAVTTLVSSVTVSGTLPVLSLMLWRYGADALDTATQDARIFGMSLRKLT